MNEAQDADAIERTSRALSLPLLICAAGILGAIALIANLAATLQPVRSAPTVAFIERADRFGTLTNRVLATAITPITSLSAAASGLAYSGESYDVACTVSGTVTLYPVVHDGSAWEGPYQMYPCILDASVATMGTCTFPARTGGGLTWNAFKTGSGSVSSCTAEGRAGPVPASRSASPFGPAGGDLSGTYPSPTVDGIQGRAVASTAPANGQVLWWVSASNEWQPTTLSGLSPGGVASGDLSGTYPGPTVAKLQGRSVSSLAPANGQVLWWVAAANEWQPTTLATGSGTVTSVGLSMPSIFSVGGSPVTDAGTLAVSLATQVANRIFAGPSSGADAAPTFRALVAADIPDLSADKTTSGTFDIARIPIITNAKGGLGSDISSTAANLICASPDGSAGGVSMRAMVAGDVPGLPASKITSGQLAKAQGGTGEDNSTGGTANTVWARPNGSTGAASYRALVSDDIPSLAASKIGSGQFDIARIPTGTSSSTVPTGGVVTGVACAYPTTFTFNDAGQVTACTAGSAPVGTLVNLSTGTIPGPSTEYLFTGLGTSLSTAPTGPPTIIRSSSCTITSLYAGTQNTPAGGTSHVFTVRKSSDRGSTWTALGGTSVTCTVAAGGFTCSNSSTGTMSVDDWISVSLNSSDAAVAGGAVAQFALTCP